MTAAPDRDRWIRRLGPALDAGVRLVCFPHAGGAATYFLPWVPLLVAGGVEILAVQYPGRQDRLREPTVGSVAELVAGVVAALPRYSDRPYAFFGHSMGAVVAYEAGRLLADSVGPATGPVALVVSGRRAPSCFRDDPLPTEDVLRADLLASGATDPRLLADPEAAEMIMPGVRADHAAIYRYHHRPGSLLTCPVWVLTGDGDPKTTVAEASAWRRHTTAGCELTVLPGGHFFLDHQRPVVARVLLEALGAVAPAPGERR